MACPKNNYCKQVTTKWIYQKFIKTFKSRPQVLSKQNNVQCSHNKEVESQWNNIIQTVHFTIEETLGRGAEASQSTEPCCQPQFIAISANSFLHAEPEVVCQNLHPSTMHFQDLNNSK